MKIYCHKCGKFLGEIRDASLRIGIKYLCRDCIPQKPTNTDYFDQNVDLLRDLMGMKK